MLTYADTYVGIFSKLIPTVVETYKDTFPELEAKQQLIMEVVREEEESFEKMLVGGIKYFKDVSASMAAAKQTVVSGSKASKLSTSKASTLEYK
jgi:alanyl-tRNA synthetase